MKVDNSGGGQVWVPKKGRLGLAENELLHLSYGQSSVYRVLRQDLPDGQVQGGVVKLPIKLSSSAQRAAFHRDGSMYVVGMRAWQSNAAKEAGFQRVRYQEGRSLGVPEFLSVKGDQLTLRFDCALDEELANDLESFSIKRWKYIRGPQYGSGQFSIDNPDLAAEENALEQESKSHKRRDKVEVYGGGIERGWQNPGADHSFFKTGSTNANRLRSGKHRRRGHDWNSVFHHP